MLVKFRGKRKWFRAVWMQHSTVKMIDQCALPARFSIATLESHRETAKAIENMTVRGAGSIGAAAAFGAAQAVLEAPRKKFNDYVEKGFARLRSTRPTAFDLFWAIGRVERAVKGKNLEKAGKAAVKEAEKISDEYAKRGEMIGKHGQKLLKNGTRMLTHCNAGWLALQDWGSALAPVYAAKRQGKKVFVFADETRPRMQGSRLTAWELVNESIPHRIIADNAAGYYMQRGEIDLCIVGADRIAANGDIANKIGTYEKAVLAKECGIPFYVAAPTSTFDLECEKGGNIPIEERAGKEVLFCSGKRIAPRKSKAFNPGFDVTPRKYVRGIITEEGIIKPNRKSIKGLF